MRPTARQIADAVSSMSGGLVKYFPSGEDAQRAVMLELQRIVPTVKALNWLVEQYVRRIGEWHSLKELRGVLCAYCDPLDGIPALSEIPGYTPNDIEALNTNRAAIDTEHRLASQKQIAAPEDPEETAKLQADIEALGRRISLKNAQRRARPVREVDVKTPGYLQ